jgi:hypothetical protein
VARGISPEAAARKDDPLGGGKYYEYYTHFWVWDGDFCKNPHDYPHLTREDARRIEATIDGYNTLIEQGAKDHGWHVIPYCTVLDQLAFRRNQGRPGYRFPDAMVAALKNNSDTAWRVYPDAPDGSQRVLVDARYFNIKSDVKEDKTKFEVMQDRYRGGLFSLDGMHPTTVGYGIMAHEALKVMKAAGVPGADPGALAWDKIVENDSLLRKVPEPVENLQNLMGFVSGQSVLARLIRSLSGYGSQKDE